MSWTITPDLALYLIVGAILGSFYFGVLLWTVRLHTLQAAASRVIPLYLVRLAAAGVAFWVVAQQGALPLLITLLGFLIARIAMQRWLKLV